MSLLYRMRRFLDSFRGEPRPDKLKALQPKVTPDARAAAALERRFSELAYEPENGFARDTQVSRANVVQFRRRA